VFAKLFTNCIALHSLGIFKKRLCLISPTIFQVIGNKGRDLRLSNLERAHQKMLPMVTFVSFVGLKKDNLMINNVFDKDITNQ